MDVSQNEINAALKLLGVADGEVVKARYEYDDLVLIVDRGIKGTQKHRIPLDRLQAPEEPEAQPEEEAPKPKTRRRATAKGG